ncbi:MAG: hypothetical protein HW388_36 [Dehalococcoidia bacterium]|nr:hypothetical protein [Dehalococcoidia bacterium]
MAEIQPFKGIRYNPQLASNLERLLCPPYDVITPEQQRELHNRSPYNVIRLELGMSQPSDSDGANRYTRAAALLEEWLGQGVLVSEKKAAFYLLQEEFPHLGRVRTRRSLLARVRLEDFSRRVVIPHEETSQGPKRDRMELLKATRANLSPIMGIYRDPSGDLSALLGRAMAGPPLVRADYGDSHIRLWALAEEGAMEAIRGSLKDAPVFLADGHHRYETALLYRDIQRARGGARDGEDGHGFVMMTLTEISDPGLLALPYHRLVRGLSPGELERVVALAKKTFAPISLAAKPGLDDEAALHLMEQLEGVARTQVALGLLEHGAEGASILALRGSPGASSSPLERCATWVLAKRVLEPGLRSQEEAVERGILRFTPDPQEVYRLVRGGDFQMGFLLPPLDMDLFEEVVLSGERMPLKSTYFTPKLPTGLVINRLVG